MRTALLITGASQNDFNINLIDTLKQMQDEGDVIVDIKPIITGNTYYALIISDYKPKEVQNAL